MRYKQLKVIHWIKPTKAELISASSLRKTEYIGGIEEIAKNGSESHIRNWTIANNMR